MKRDVLSVGMTVIDLLVGQVDQLPPPEGLMVLDGFQINTGGVASTFARDCARLGLSCGLVSAVGDDVLGHIGLQFISTDGVDLEDVTQVYQGKTGSTIVLIDPTGERRFLYYPGVVDQMKSPDEVDLSKYRHVHIGGVPLVSKYNGQEGLKFLQRAHQEGLTTSLDTVMATENHWDSVRLMLREVDIAMPSYVEAEKITEESEPLTQAKILLDLGVHTAVIKLGAKGALLWQKGGEPFQVVPPSIDVVDTTGAGEAFCAGFIYGWLSNWEIVDTAKFSVICGSMATQEVGGPSALKHYDEVKRWAHEHHFEPQLRQFNERMK